MNEVSICAIIKYDKSFKEWSNIFISHRWNDVINPYTFTSLYYGPMYLTIYQLNFQTQSKEVFLIPPDMCVVHSLLSRWPVKSTLFK